MQDVLRLLNVRLTREIVGMNKDELWEFIQTRLETVEKAPSKHDFETWLFLCLYDSFEWFKERYFRETKDESNFNNLKYTLILDFAFEGEKIKLDYFGVGGFYDEPASCRAPKSEHLMPEIDMDSDDYYHRIDFYVLDVHYLDKIIEALEKYVAKLTLNTAEDIEKIKALRDKCASDENYRVAYIYKDWR